SAAARLSARTRGLRRRRSRPPCLRVWSVRLGRATPTSGGAGGVALQGTAVTPPIQRGKPASWLYVLGLLSAISFGGIACRALRRVRVEPVAPAASEEMGAAESVLRAADSGKLERASAVAEAREHLARALAAEPEWVAPRRLSDELDRDDLRGI